jgi:ADP-ribose pyrophosphatase YjhB (NUDIX family)
MKLLEEIKDQEFLDEAGYEIREASRAVLFDKDGKVPILFVSKHNYYKLPGGGVEEGEGKEEALKREIKEEVGSEIEITGEIGTIIEFRSKWKIKQISYCYLGKVTTIGEPSFTEKELEDGFRLVWLPLDEAIKKIEKENVSNYQGSLVKRRDLIFLKKAKEIIKN